MTKAVSPALAAAEAQLRGWGVGFVRTSPYQLKIGDVSFWPGKGTIFVDEADHRHPGTGLDALAALLRQRGHRLGDGLGQGQGQGQGRQAAEPAWFTPPRG